MGSLKPLKRPIFHDFLQLLGMGAVLFGNARVFTHGSCCSDCAAAQ